MDKEELREYINKRKRQLTRQQLEALSLPITHRIFRHKSIKAARNILLYYSLPDEVNTHILIDKLISKGKTVLLPKVINDHELSLHVYKGIDSLQQGAFDIMEPTGEPYTDYAAISLAFIPGVAFDSNNHRLGRGKGYYDRLLFKLRNAYKIGVCFAFQKVESVPTNEYDIQMDEII